MGRYRTVRCIGSSNFEVSIYLLTDQWISRPLWTIPNFQLIIGLSPFPLQTCGAEATGREASGKHDKTSPMLVRGPVRHRSYFCVIH